MMQIIELKRRKEPIQNKKLDKQYLFMHKLIAELNKRDLPLGVSSAINQNIENLNAFTGSSRTLLKTIRKSKVKIVNLLEKELKIVPKNHYMLRWLAIGMASFGVPIGVAFGVSMGNMSLLAIGLPIGLAIGVAIGAGMDKKAMDEGRQLDLEM